jgi:MFS family permease
MRSLNRYERLLTFGGRIHYAWVVVVASGVVALIGVEPLSLFGIFLGPICKDLGVSRGSVSTAYWIAWLCLGVGSIASGWATDRIGTRKILVISTLGTVVSLMLLLRANQLWQFHLWYGVVYGLCRAGFTIPALITITLWFRKRQGLAVGIASSGLAVGPFIFAPVFQHLIDRYGWGESFFILGIISGVILAPCCWLIRNRPSDVGLRPYGDDEPETVPVKNPIPAHQPMYYRTDLPNFFRYAMTTQPFFLLPLIHLLGCVSHAIPLAHMVVMATDKGIDPISASMVLGIAVGLSAVSRLTAPILSDRMGGRKVLVIFILMQGISILWLLPARELWAFYLFSVFFGLCYGGEMTPFPILNRQYYGLAPIGTIFGIQTTAASVGMGIGGFIGGALYDFMGNYTVAIWVSALTGFAAAGFSYLLVDPFNPGRRHPDLKMNPAPNR